MKIVVLCGGLSAERDVSLSSAAQSSAALRRCGHDVTCVDLFLGVVEPTAKISATAPDLDALREIRPGKSRIGDDVFALCQAADLVFIALHGTDGEDGKIQAAFDLIGVKYTGTGVLGSALAMNKSVAKAVMDQSGIKVAKGITLHRGGAVENVGFPCVVKPCSGGSSVGTSIVQNAAEYEKALTEAFRYDDSVVVEQFVGGRECDVGVIAGRALPVIEICPREGFFDYKSKYQEGLTDEICPAPFDPETTTRLQDTAFAVFHALNLEVYARMDFIVSDSGEIYCLEANTLPGLTPASLMPQEAAAAGINYDAFISLIVEESLKKYGDS